MTAAALNAALEPLDKTRALKALLFDAKLSPMAMRVGALLIEHYNLKTGRCFPGWDRLTRILGCDRSTIARALKQLRVRGYMRHRRHAERGSASAYDPNWQLFRQKAGAVEHAAMTGSPINQVAELPQERLQDCDLGGGEAATQTLERTFERNLEKENSLCSNSTEQIGANTPKSAPEQRLLEIEEGRAERPKPSPQPPRPAQRSFLLPIAGSGYGREQNSRQVAENKAWDRIERGVRLHFGGGYESPGYSRLLAAVTHTLQRDLTAAEISKPGRGLTLALNIAMGVSHAA